MTAFAQEAPPPAAETAALLLSPDPDLQRKGLAVLEAGRPPAYEHEVLRLLARWARDPDGWADTLAPRRNEPTVKRMLEALKPVSPVVNVEVLVVAAPEEVAQAVVGAGRDTVVSADAARWRAWAASVADAKVVFTGSAPGNVGDEIEAKCIRSIAYVKDFELKVGGNVVAADPVVDQVEVEGRATWRPVLSADGRFLTLDLTLQLRDVTLREEDKALTPERDVRIQVPETVDARQRTSVTLPVGGHAAWMLAEEGKGPWLVLVRAARADYQIPRKSRQGVRSR